MKNPLGSINSIWGYTKSISSAVLIGLWVVFGSYLLFPQVVKHILPRMLDIGPVWGKTHQYHSLDPLVANQKLPSEMQIENLYWDLDGEVIKTSEVSFDSRKRAVELLLLQFDSPMAPHADDFVKWSDKYGNDWRLAVSISGVESGFGRIIPENSYNGWGWKGGENGDFSDFNSWEHSIKYITERLAKGYGTDITPMAMESTYCPPCGATGKHYWANGVETYMHMLEQYRQEINKAKNK